MEKKFTYHNKSYDLLNDEKNDIFCCMNSVNFKNNKNKNYLFFNKYTFLNLNNFFTKKLTKSKHFNQIFIFIFKPIIIRYSINTNHSFSMYLGFPVRFFSGVGYSDVPLSFLVTLLWPLLLLYLG